MWNICWGRWDLRHLFKRQTFQTSVRRQDRHCSHKTGEKTYTWNICLWQERHFRNILGDKIETWYICWETRYTWTLRRQILEAFSIKTDNSDFCWETLQKYLLIISAVLYISDVYLYSEKCHETKLLLENLAGEGKKLFLVSNSGFPFMWVPFTSIILAVDGEMGWIKFEELMGRT